MRSATEPATSAHGDDCESHLIDHEQRFGDGLCEWADVVEHHAVEE